MLCEVFCFLFFGLQGLWQAVDYIFLVGLLLYWLLLLFYVVEWLFYWLRGLCVCFYLFEVEKK